MKKCVLLAAVLSAALSLSSCQSVPSVAVPVSPSEGQTLPASSAGSDSYAEGYGSSSSGLSSAGQFDASSPTGSQSVTVQTSALEVPESTPAVEQAKNDALFKGEPVLNLYSLDFANRLYHPVGDLEKASEILLALESQEVDVSVPGNDKVGYLVFTNQSRYAYYFGCHLAG